MDNPHHFFHRSRKDDQTAGKLLAIAFLCICGILGLAAGWRWGLGLFLAGFAITAIGAATDIVKKKAGR